MAAAEAVLRTEGGSNLHPVCLERQALLPQALPNKANSSQIKSSDNLFHFDTEICSNFLSFGAEDAKSSVDCLVLQCVFLSRASITILRHIKALAYLLAIVQGF